MKIGLMGFEFNSPNKGCEALTYSIIDILNNIEEVNENSTIYNFSGTGLGKIPQEFSNFNFIEVQPKLKDLSFKYIKALKNCDIIFDVTMGDSFSDIYSEKGCNNLIRHKRIAELLCKNYILLPQTYGPFNSLKIKNKALKIFKKAKKIYCRDEISKKILEKEFNIKDIKLVSDMAFILPYKKDKYFLNSDKKKIGINISGLLYKGGFERNNQFNLTLEYKDYMDKLINFCLNNNYEVHLISHVIDLSTNSYDDDYKVCENIKQKYNKCILAPVFETPIEAKSYISNMDIFIGSRMHSTIAAFSSGVITIPVSYSRKFEGLFGSLNYKYVVNGKKDTTEEAFDKTIEYLKNYDKLKASQEKAFRIIDEKKMNFINELKKDLNSAKR